MKKKLTILLLIFASASISFSQNQKDTTKAKEEPTSGTTVTCDVVSRYIWRGQEYGKSPNIQPTFSYFCKNFEIGAWGSFNFNGTYSEIDPYVKYTIKNFSLTVNDYFNHDESSPNNIKYNIYDKNFTKHTLEGVIGYKGSEKFPFYILVGTYFYGADKSWGYDLKKDTTTKNYYSTYIEAGYSFLIKKKNKLDVCLGMTPFAGAYGNTAGVVCLCVSGSRDIKISESFSLPVKTSLIYNPQLGNLFFVFGFTL